MQIAQALHFQVNHIPVHQRAQAPVIGAGGYNIPRLQRMDGSNPLHNPGYLMRHIAGVVVLLHLPIDLQRHLPVQRVGELIGGNYPRANRGKGSPRFHLIKGIARRQHPPRRPVNKVQVAKDVIVGILRLDIAGRLADDQSHLSLKLKDSGGNIRQNHRILRADDAVRRLEKGVDGGRLRTRAVLHIVHRHTNDGIGLGQRRPQLRRTQRRPAFPANHRLNAAPVLLPIRDNPVYQVLRRSVGNAADGGRNIHHRIALDHAQLEIVKEYQFHPLTSLPQVAAGRTPGRRIQTNCP